MNRFVTPPGEFKMFERWPGLEEEIKRWEDAKRHLPTQDEIDEVIRLAHGTGDLVTSSALKEFASSLGIAIQKISKDFAIVYWAGDPLVKDVLKASLRELPEFLSSEFSDARTIAKWRLDALT